MNKNIDNRSVLNADAVAKQRNGIRRIFMKQICYHKIYDKMSSLFSWI